MKLNKIIIPVLAAPLLLTGCYDEKMDWHTPDGHYPVVSDEIPLSLQEKIANYDNIKAYMAQYMPNVSSAWDSEQTNISLTTRPM